MQVRFEIHIQNVPYTRWRWFSIRVSKTKFHFRSIEWHGVIWIVCMLFCVAFAHVTPNIFLLRLRFCRRFSIPNQISGLYFKSISCRIVSVSLIISRFAGYSFSALMTNDMRMDKMVTKCRMMMMMYQQTTKEKTKNKTQKYSGERRSVAQNQRISEYRSGPTSLTYTHTRTLMHSMLFINIYNIRLLCIGSR